MSKEMKMRLLPWLLIFGGFYLLTKLPAVIAGGCMVVGIVMLIERICPEQWGENYGSEKSSN